ncbi:MAG: DUF3152 domain-containing protein [Actinomycetota bacterium]|nr:DUF3152 domain-containing protein [Actinomycetota bacterium]
MEKRNTLLLGTTFVFIFCSIYIITTLLFEEKVENFPVMAVEEKSIDDNLNENFELEDPTTTTTTTTMLESIPEEEPSTSYNDNLGIGESDGAEVAISNLAIFVTEEERKTRTKIETVDLAEGCLTENKNINPTEQWELLENSNSYKKDTINISLKIEAKVDIGLECASNLILKVLNDSRGWSSIVGKEFQFTSLEKSDFEIIFATPDTVDQLCAPLATNGIYSCRRENRVVLNYFRWIAGARDFGTDLATYRLYLINHEVGHMLGWGHTTCPAEGALAPLMMQQSKSTNGCLPYGWPTYERLESIFDIQD